MTPKSKQKRVKNIYLPHINYTVKVRQAENPPEDLMHAKGWVESEGQYGCILYIDLKHKINPADLSHELIHVLQFICLNRNMDFKLEQEHLAYIMHYLMGEIMGFEWVK